MALTEATIGKKIREAREQLGMTQKDLATHLKRTSAAISDLERGKVQVTAVHLHKLANVLKKPLEYFYDEDFGGKDMEDLIALMRRANPESRANSINTLRIILKMETVTQALQTTSDRQEQWKLLAEFMQTFQELSGQLQKFSSLGQQMQGAFSQILTPENQDRFLNEGRFEVDEQTKEFMTKIIQSEE